MAPFLSVAIDTPLRRLFDYRAPANGVATPQAGARVRVPFGRRRLIGVIVGSSLHSDVPADRLRTVEAVLDTEPLLDPGLLGLLRWASDYYQHPIGEVVAAALPSALRDGAPLRAQQRYWRLTSAGEAWLEERNAGGRAAPRQRQVLEALARAAGPATADDLAAIPDAGRVLARLVASGLADCGSRDLLKDTTGNTASGLSSPAPTPLREREPELGAAQAEALRAIQGALGSYASILLDGVTGSGKTEVYLRAIAAVLARGDQALVLVPEISLTPQQIDRFATRFAVPIAVMHSSLTGGDRLAAWRAARSGEAGIVIGTRSAIFAGLARPGLIVVDEEHDASYKQQEGFRYSARDLALVRAKRLGIPVVLGSATPSLESLARVGRSTAEAPAIRLVLPERAGTAQPPRWSLVDLRRHAANQGLAIPTLEAMRRHLDAGSQVLVFLNRRGYAPALYCPQCGWCAPCPRCDARLTVHRREQRLRCHHCGLESDLPNNCPSCHATVKPVGQGTERIEEVLAQLFPDVPQVRVDRDQVRNRDDLTRAMARIASGEARLLIGTQMLSKGHHFPLVTLVVVLNADQGLYSTDFRGSERLAQTTVQVAGRAGRATRPGEVLIQSEYPEHPLLQQLLQGGYAAFAATALEDRRAAGWPPFARLTLLRAEAARETQATRFLGAVATRLEAPARQARIELLGPAPAPMQRRAGRFRSQLLLRAHDPARGATGLQRLLHATLPDLDALPEARGIRWSVDVDPLELF